MYRLSNYNYFVPYQDKMIYFNGISDKVFSLNLRNMKIFSFYSRI